MSRKARSEPYREFWRVERGFERLVNELGVKVARRDVTMFVDTASLYGRLALIRRFIRTLVDSRPNQVEPKLLTHRAGRLSAEIENLGRYVRDLSGPLDRLHSKLIRRAPYYSAGMDESNGKASNLRMHPTVGAKRRRSKKRPRTAHRG